MQLAKTRQKAALRLSQERRHIFNARYANTGRPKCSVEAQSANPPSVNDTNAANFKRADCPKICNSQIAANAPTDNCVSTVMKTNGQ